MATISRSYRSYDTASRIVSQLEAIGVATADISIISGGADGRHDGERSMEQVGEEAADGAMAGAGVGAALGGAAGLLAGLGVLAIPGVGPALAAGWLATTAAGAAIGGATGGMLGALVDAGIPDSDAEYYAESVRRGHTLVVARPPADLEARAQEIMDGDAVDIAATRDSWRNEGWRGFDPAAPALTREQIERYRVSDI